MLAGIVALDLAEKLPLREAKSRQSVLAEASIDAALEITKAELASRLKTEITDLPLAVLGLGKLGGGGIDYDSDLDIVLVYDEKALDFSRSHADGILFAGSRDIRHDAFGRDARRQSLSR